MGRERKKNKTFSEQGLASAWSHWIFMNVPTHQKVLSAVRNLSLFLAACSQSMSYTFSDLLLGSTKRVQQQVPLLPLQRSPILQKIPGRCSTILQWHILLSSYCGVWKHDEDPYGKRYLSVQCFHKNKGEKYKSPPHLECLIIHLCSSGQGD